MSIREIRSAAMDFRERWSGSLSLETVSAPSVEVAAELDRTGKRIEAARHYFTLAEQSEGETRAFALIQLSQMFINLGRFSQAESILQNIEVYLPLLGENKAYYAASVSEKRAWICDYKGDYRGEINYLAHARHLLELDRMG